jgi:hypothetical protein
MILKKSQWKKIELVPGWLDYKNAQLFITLSNPRLLGIGNFLEIGVFFGKSAVAIGYAKQDKEKIVLIDPFESLVNPSNNFNEDSQISLYQDLTLKKMLNFFKFAHKFNPETYIGSSKDILPKMTQKFKFIHVDGAHNYLDVKMDIEYSLQLLSYRSLIVFDDYSHADYPGVTEAINEAIEEGIIVPLLNTGKLYCCQPTSHADLSNLIEKYLNEDGFKVVKNLKRSIFDPFFQIEEYPKPPKAYSYFYRRLLTAYLIRKK